MFSCLANKTRCVHRNGYSILHKTITNPKQFERVTLSRCFYAKVYKEITQQTQKHNILPLTFWITLKIASSIHKSTDFSIFYISNKWNVFNKFSNRPIFSQQHGQIPNVENIGCCHTFILFWQNIENDQMWIKRIDFYPENPNYIH